MNMQKLLIPSVKANRLLFLIVVATVLGAPRTGHAEVIDFETFSGPSTFAAAGDATTLSVPTAIGTVTISGGVILTNATNLPADETSIYGTAGNASNIGVTVGTGFTNPLTITFPVAINNFFVDVLNGNTMPVTYRVADNMGNSNTTVLNPNLSGGNELVSFAATGTVVTVGALTGQSTPTGMTWDFFFDNIHFDEPLPAVPLPATLPLFATGLGALGLLGWRRKKKAAA